MGLEFRDGAFLLSAKSSRILSPGMVFNLALGFQDMEEPNGQKYVTRGWQGLQLIRNADTPCTSLIL